MTPESYIAFPDRDEQMLIAYQPLWAIRTMLLWKQRRMLARIAVIAFLVSLGIAFILPKHYKSSTSIMPPDQQGSGAMMLAALAGHSESLGALGGLASGLLGAHSSTDLFIEMLHSSSVSDHLIDRFNL